MYSNVDREPDIGDLVETPIGMRLFIFHTLKDEMLLSSAVIVNGAVELQFANCKTNVNECKLIRSADGQYTSEGE